MSVIGGLARLGQVRRRLPPAVPCRTANLMSFAAHSALRHLPPSRQQALWTLSQVCRGLRDACDEVLHRSTVIEVHARRCGDWLNACTQLGPKLFVLANGNLKLLQHLPPAPLAACSWFKTCG